MATPGRLVAHLDGETGLSLEHLEFLVVDEADRLLAQSYQRWLPTVLAASFVRPAGRGEAAVSAVATRRLQPTAVTAANEAQPGPYLQKLLFSATLNHDPEQLAAVELVHPRLFLVGQGTAAEETDAAGYAVPPTLQERALTCAGAHKPLALLHLLASRQFTRVLVFTASVEATHRLAVLLDE